MKKLLYLLLLCLSGSLLFVETSDASICDTKETIIFYGNGVSTIKKEAFKAKESLKMNLKNIMLPEDFELLAFDLAYNNTHALPLDLFESTIQFLTNNTRRFWHIIFGHEVIPDPVAETFLLLSDALNYSALITTDSLRDHVKTYQNAIDEGKRIILVAHSQGNLYGNQAYNLLTNQEKQSFGMVSVANVDNNVLGDFSDSALYTTLTSDWLIQAIIAGQLNLPTSPMNPNTENEVLSDEFWGHSFINSYMIEGSNSQNQIISDILVSLDTLPVPYQLVDPGVITVSLTWGNAPDVDLHVYEPNGSHVYWFNLEGISGYLDADDRSGYGPEHYRVLTCDMLEEGIYRIGLDYYLGDNPETATVQIEAGLLVRTFTVSMPSDIFGAEYNPYRVANIMVQKDGTGGFGFDIYH
jgi:hypothetical protein